LIAAEAVINQVRFPCPGFIGEFGISYLGPGHGHQIRPPIAKDLLGVDRIADLETQPIAIDLRGERDRAAVHPVERARETLAVFAHGGTNAAILGWATGVGLAAFGLLDQSTCCLNVIDFDVDDSGRLLRKTVRGMNITAYDPVMHRRDASDMELLARQLLKWRE